MVSSSEIEPSILEKLHLDALPKITRNAFLKCVEIPFFSKNGWYLAGGTALALQTGHRQSIDLDFFTSEEMFDEKKAEESMSVSGDWKTSSISKNTVYGEFNGAKISLIAYPFFRAHRQFLKVGNVSILKPEDIAAMKIVAISQRGRKRDFFDLYWLSLNIQPLLESVKAAEKQYVIKQNPTHVLKSLAYFEDAEGDPNPKIYFNATWKEVKKFFQREIGNVAKKIVLES